MDMKKILQAMDGVSSKPVEGANDMKKFVSIIQEGANPHKVALPVQMAMQHYQQPVVKAPVREPVIGKFFKQVEDELMQEKAERKELINQYASVIAERVMMRESKLSELSSEKLGQYKKAAGAQASAADKAGDYEKGNKRFKGIVKATIKQGENDAKKDVAEGHGSEELANEVYSEFERIYPNLARRANERTIHAAIIDVLNYGGDSNPRALAQDVARAVKRDIEQGVTENIGNPPDAVTVDIPLLIRLFEYAREDAKADIDLHNVAERMVALSNQGRTLTMNDYDEICSVEQVDEACWKDYKQIGMKKKGSKTVPNCVPKK